MKCRPQHFWTLLEIFSSVFGSGMVIYCDCSCFVRGGAKAMKFWAKVANMGEKGPGLILEEGTP